MRPRWEKAMAGVGMGTVAVADPRNCVSDRKSASGSRSASGDNSFAITSSWMSGLANSGDPASPGRRVRRTSPERTRRRLMGDHSERLALVAAPAVLLSRVLGPSFVQGLVAGAVT
jgi:hypothetical protein